MVDYKAELKERFEALSGKRFAPLQALAEDRGREPERDAPDHFSAMHRS